jgi:hypothetical protein
LSTCERKRAPVPLRRAKAEQRGIPTVAVVDPMNTIDAFDHVPAVHLVIMIGEARSPSTPIEALDRRCASFSPRRDRTNLLLLHQVPTHATPSSTQTARRGYRTATPCRSASSRRGRRARRASLLLLRPRNRPMTTTCCPASMNWSASARKSSKLSGTVLKTFSATVWVPVNAPFGARPPPGS